MPSRAYRDREAARRLAARIDNPGATPPLVQAGEALEALARATEPPEWADDERPYEATRSWLASTGAAYRAAQDALERRALVDRSQHKD